MAIQQNGFLKVFTNECQQLFQQPKRLLLYIGVPIFMFFLYASIFGNGVLNNLPIAIMDNDKTALSRELVRQINASPTMDIIEDLESESQGQYLMRTGQVYGWVIIPSGFERTVNAGRNENIVLYVNNNFLTPAGLINKAFNTVIGTFGATAKVSVLMKTGANIQQAKEAVQPIVVDNHTLFNPYLNYNFYLSLALFPMALQLMVVIVSIYVLGSVLKYNQGKALLTMSGNSVWNAYWGKMLPYTILYAFIGFGMNAYLYNFLGIPTNASWGGIYWLTIMLVVVYQLITLFFVTLMKDFRSLASFGGGYSALAFSFSGYTFPQQAMSIPMQIVDLFFPFTAYTRMLTNTVIKGMPLSNSIYYVLGFALFAIIGFLSMPKFKAMLEKGGYDHA